MGNRFFFRPNLFASSLSSLRLLVFPHLHSPAMAVPCGPHGSPLVASSVAISSSDSLSANFFTPRTAASRAFANAVPSSLRSSFFIHSILRDREGGESSSSRGRKREHRERGCREERKKELEERRRNG